MRRTIPAALTLALALATTGTLSAQHGPTPSNFSPAGLPVTSGYQTLYLQNGYAVGMGPYGFPRDRHAVPNALHMAGTHFEHAIGAYPKPTAIAAPVSCPHGFCPPGTVVDGYVAAPRCPVCQPDPWAYAAARGKIWRPTHYQTFEYKYPKNLAYPPANHQPAIVQYPYYTVKGPTDFFMK